MKSENKQNRRYKQITFTGLQNNRHPSQHTFGNVHKASGNCLQRPFLGIHHRTAVTHWIAATSAKRAPFMMLFRWGNRKKCTGTRSGEYGGWSRTGMLCWAKNLCTIIVSQTQTSYSVQACYHAATSTVQSCATLAEHAQCVIATVSNLPCRMQLHCTVNLPLTLTTFDYLQQVYPEGHLYSTLGGASWHVSE